MLLRLLHLASLALSAQELVSCLPLPPVVPPHAELQREEQREEQPPQPPMSPAVFVKVRCKRVGSAAAAAALRIEHRGADLARLAMISELRRSQTSKLHGLVLVHSAADVAPWQSTAGSNKSAAIWREADSGSHSTQAPIRPHLRLRYRQSSSVSGECASIERRGRVQGLLLEPSCHCCCRCIAARNVGHHLDSQHDAGPRLESALTLTDM